MGRMVQNDPGQHVRSHTASVDHMLPPPHHHCRSRAGHRPAEIGCYLCVLHLAATTLAIVVGMLAPAIGPDRTAIVRIVAELADVLYHHGDAVGVTLAEVATRCVVRSLSPEHDGTIRDVVAALALLAEAVILE